MAARIRFIDFRFSRGPKVLGLCNDDRPNLAEYVNTAQRRLLFAKEAGEEGWYGTFAEVLFNGVSRTTPYITCDRHIARIEALTVCNAPVPVQNPFYEYLDFGNGRMPRLCPCDNFGVMQGFTRNNVVTFRSLPHTSQKIRIYSTDPVDGQSGIRVLLQGWDQNGQTITSQDVSQQVEGEYVTMDTPFATSQNYFSGPSLAGIQKDASAGTIKFYAVDTATGDETLFHSMEPSELVAGYRRYYLNNLPCTCCPPATTAADPVQVKAICKLEIIPVAVDQDYLLLHNLEAVIEECKSVRFSDMDDAASRSQSAIHHLNAVRLLKSELVHRYGKDEPAVNFQPFGSAKLEQLNIGMM